MHGVMHIGKMVNAKVMNYDLRELDTEKKKKLNDSCCHVNYVNG